MQFPFYQKKVFSPSMNNLLQFISLLILHNKNINIKVNTNSL